MKLTVLPLFLLIAMASQSKSSSSYSDLVRHFDYDQKAPLGIQTVGSEDRAGVKVQDISYASPKGGRVPAYLVIPPGKGPFVAILFGHWCMPGSPTKNRTEFLDEAVLMARSGAISLLPDHVISRPGYVGRPEGTVSDQDAEELLQQVLDLRRGVDLLLARSDVDPKRIAYVGHSCDASAGGILAGVDKRFHAFVLMAGSLSDETDNRTPEMQEFRKKMGAEKFDAFTAKWNWLDPGKYVGHAAPAAVFLQYATQEKFLTTEHAKEYLPLVSEPKTVKFYDAPHALNAEARKDRVEFLRQKIDLKPIEAAAVAAIPQTK